MTRDDKRLLGWLLIAAVAGALVWVLLVWLALPINPVLAIASPIIL